MQTVDLERLVFLDEAAAHTVMSAGVAPSSSRRPAFTKYVWARSEAYAPNAALPPTMSTCRLPGRPLVNV